jgi:hypothetical protein
VIAHPSKYPRTENGDTIAAETASSTTPKAAFANIYSMFQQWQRGSAAMAPWEKY